MAHNVPWASKYSHTAFLEPVRASSHVRLIESRSEMQTNLNSQRQKHDNREEEGTTEEGANSTPGRCLCWVLPPIKGWDSFIDLYSPRGC